jgi:ankyrin repeat protein
VKNDFGSTMLHIAAANGHEAMVRLLVEARADVNAMDNHGRTVLVEAARTEIVCAGAGQAGRGYQGEG